MSQMFARPPASRITGFVFATLPVESVYEARLVVVPAAYVNTWPLARGLPEESKNWALGVPGSKPKPWPKALAMSAEAMSDVRRMFMNSPWITGRREQRKWLMRECR